MRVATWNVNNVVKRLDLLVAWLERTRPDVVALQELKTPTEAFPTDELAAAGYSSLVVGQRTWNGVALLARGHEPLEVLKVLPGDPTDREARYVEAAINGTLFACLYLPNGNPQPGPKFDYKLRWFERMRARAEALWSSGQPVVLLGDWNVVPTDADIYKPDTWRDDALLQPEVREAFAEVLAQGWTDALAAKHPKKPPFTFWDYRRKRWERDAGLRIDHILVSSGFEVVDAGVDREERGAENPSDHAPVWAELKPIKARRKRAKAGGSVGTSAPSSRTANAPVVAPARTPSGTGRVRPASIGEAPAALAAYNAKRDFTKTPEPAGQVATRERGKAKAKAPALAFVIQKHRASHLHYDFRLELDGVMVSWAVPKGPSLDPAIKQMAIHVEDHPLSYNGFEGTIPKGSYGAGNVIVWDRGSWEPVGDPRDGLAKGKVVFKLHGEKLAGLWELVRISKPGDKKQDQWLLFKKRGDAWSRPSAEFDVIAALPDSVITKPLGLVEERELRGGGGGDDRAAPSTPGEPDLSRAVKARLPATLAPQLATLVDSAPSGDWVVESKLDGYRMLARVEGKSVRLFTRNGNDWTAKLVDVAGAVASLGLDRAWLDGEIVVFDENGLPDFNALQNAIDGARSKDIVYFVFDLPFEGGRDLRQVPLRNRRAALQNLMAEATSERVRFNEAFDAPASQLLEAACRVGLEGVMLKRAEASYVSGRTETWLKLKCMHRQEFVVVGFTDRSNNASEVGALLLAYNEGGRLRSAGSVGTGWNTATGRGLRELLAGLEVKTPAIDPKTVVPGRWSRRTAGSEHWVRPQVIVEVAFADWTPDGHVRHATFRGMRADKAPGAIVRERPAQVASQASAKGKAAARGGVTTGVKVTNPTRVIDPSTGTTKVDLVRYYESVAEWILPHLRKRPVSLVRAPEGITGQLFFQKHLESRMPGLTELDPALWPGHTALLSVDSLEALFSAAQMNVVEFHTWNSTIKSIDEPDRFVLDLDPGEGVGWTQVQEAAMLTRAMLDELGLKSWLKTSGGKGLHVVVPLAPKTAYEIVKAFSQAIVQHMARTIPDRFVAKSGGSNRVGKIFIDYLRNGHGQTTAAAFSARARPGMGVSMPVSWDQLPELKGGNHWTVATARDHLSFQKVDPWADYGSARQPLAAAMRRLGFKPER